MRAPSARTLGLVLGAIFLGFGVAEVVTHLDDTAWALAFWGISLLGGGALVIAGTLLRPTRRTLGLTLLSVGALVATNATAWTLAVPVLAVITVVVAFRERGPAGTPGAAG